jgi:hypothetical protein
MLLFAFSIPVGSSSGSPEWLVNLTMLLILLALLLGGLGAAIGHNGLEISGDSRFYRNYFGILGWHIGRWQPLPPVVGITLKFYTEVSGGISGNGAGSWGVWDSSGVRCEKLVLLLSLQSTREGLILKEFTSNELAVARHAAQEVATRFGGVPVREYLLPART